MKERLVFDRYKCGEVIKGREWDRDPRHFGTVVFEEWKRDKAVAQISLGGETHWRRVNPTVMEPIKEYLCRPTDVQRRQERVSDQGKLISV